MKDTKRIIAKIKKDRKQREMSLRRELINDLLGVFLLILGLMLMFVIYKITYEAGF